MLDCVVPYHESYFEGQSRERMEGQSLNRDQWAEHSCGCTCFARRWMLEVSLKVELDALRKWWGCSACNGRWHIKNDVGGRFQNPNLAHSDMPDAGREKAGGGYLHFRLVIKRSYSVAANRTTSHPQSPWLHPGLLSKQSCGGGVGLF